MIKPYSPIISIIKPTITRPRFGRCRRKIMYWKIKIVPMIGRMLINVFKRPVKTVKN